MSLGEHRLALPGLPLPQAASLSLASSSFCRKWLTLLAGPRLPHLFFICLLLHAALSPDL